MKILAVLITFLSIVYANNTIDNLIVEIKNSYGDERRIKMNQLKLQLKKANLQQRAKAIAKLRKNLQHSNHPNTIEEKKSTKRCNTHTHNHMDREQLNLKMHMNKKQNHQKPKNNQNENRSKVKNPIKHNHKSPKGNR